MTPLAVVALKRTARRWPAKKGKTRSRHSGTATSLRSPPHTSMPLEPEGGTSPPTRAAENWRGPNGIKVNVSPVGMGSMRWSEPLGCPQQKVLDPHAPEQWPCPPAQRGRRDRRGGRHPRERRHALVVRHSGATLFANASHSWITGTRVPETVAAESGSGGGRAPSGCRKLSGVGGLQADSVGSSGRWVSSSPMNMVRCNRSTCWWETFTAVSQSRAASAPTSPMWSWFDTWS